jgi:uncharacterized protein YdaU (DUF1376 family)
MKTEARLNWFKMYPSDFLLSPSVMMMSFEEKSAYLLLLLYEWLQDDCALPNDDKVLSRMLGVSEEAWAAIRKTVLRKFTQNEEGRWFNERLASLRKEAVEVSEKRIANLARAKRKTRPDQMRGDEKRGEEIRLDKDAPAYAGANAKPTSPPSQTLIRLLTQAGEECVTFKITENEKTQLEELLRQDDGNNDVTYAWKAFLHDVSFEEEPQASTFITNYAVYVGKAVSGMLSANAKDQAWIAWSTEKRSQQ